jgi:hypothetical protein
MSSSPDSFNALGMKLPGGSSSHPQQRVSYVTPQHALRRILNFTGHSIDDVINNPIARNTVRVYFRLHKSIERISEISELERQWNPLG